MSLIYDARQMIKKLVIASTLIFPILLVALIYGWESIFAGSVIWLLIWFMLYGLCRGLWSLGKEKNNWRPTLREMKQERRPYLYAFWNSPTRQCPLPRQPTFRHNRTKPVGTAPSLLRIRISYTDSQRRRSRGSRRAQPCMGLCINSPIPSQMKNVTSNKD